MRILHPYFKGHNNLRQTFSDGELHIWKSSLLSNHEKLYENIKLLSPIEREKAKQFKKYIIARRYINSHANLRKIISFYLNISPSEIVLIEGKYKKPMVTNANNLVFNMSHSLDIAVYVIANNSNIGIDIEHRNPIDFQNITKMVLTEQEIDYLNHLPSNFQIDAFYRYWTCKEAFLKAIGEGFHFNPKKIETCLMENYDINIKKINGKFNASMHWYPICIEIDKNYISTLVTDTYPSHYQLFELTN